MRISWRLEFTWLGLGIVGLVLAAYLIIGAGLKWYSSQLAADLAGAAGSSKLSSVAYESRQKHEITLLDHGLSSLYARLALIRSAKRSIELEFFIYDLDFSAKWITSELVARANQGIQIRLLVDFAGPVFQLQPEYAQLLKQHGIEVRYYNTSPGYRIVSIHHRNHRKLLVVDDEAAILGGRNIADAYFGLSPEYNFLDSDVRVQGDIVKGIRGTFDMYWVSRYASPPGLKAPRDFLALEPGEADRRARIESAGRDELASEVVGACHDTAYVTDFPGIAESNRRVYRTIAGLLDGAQIEVVGESPYFVLKEEGAALVESVTRRGVNLQVLTNSLQSTDAFYTVAILWRGLGQVADTGLTLRAFQELRPGTVEGVASRVVESSRWGIHSKRAVIDSKQYLIGTYNIDPRSANLNSEMILVCRDGPEIARAARTDILARMQGAPAAADRDQSDRSALIDGADLPSKLRMLLVTPLADLFDFLL
jgi:putative cardiolipin synthase